MSVPATQATEDSLRQLQEKAQQVFGYALCLWQIEVASAVLKQEKDVICILATGSGKTLTFWLPLLARNNGIQIIVMPLNILGSQSVKDLAKAGINPIAINGETATPKHLAEREEERKTRDDVA